MDQLMSWLVGFPLGFVGAIILIPLAAVLSTAAILSLGWLLDKALDRLMPRRKR